MLHWLLTAFNTYVRHPEHGNGYQWWSGLGLGTGIVGATWHRFNCHEPLCLRTVRHGKSYCPRHERQHERQHVD